MLRVGTDFYNFIPGGGIFRTGDISRTNYANLSKDSLIRLISHSLHEIEPRIIPNRDFTLVSETKNWLKKINAFSLNPREQDRVIFEGLGLARAWRSTKFDTLICTDRLQRLTEFALNLGLNFATQPVFVDETDKLEFSIYELCYSTVRKLNRNLDERNITTVRELLGFWQELEQRKADFKVEIRFKNGEIPDPVYSFLSNRLVEEEPEATFGDSEVLDDLNDALLLIGCELGIHKDYNTQVLRQITSRYLFSSGEIQPNHRLSNISYNDNSDTLNIVLADKTG